MCGIVAIIATKPVKEQLINALEKLEYRGYDSAGIATKEKTQIKITKKTGKVEKLKTCLQNEKHDGVIGIAHTRWATHGKVTEENAHPFSSENWCLVHNGIINNFEQLKSSYNISTTSQTDTEVIVKLIEREKTNDIFAVIKTCKKLKGSYALAIINKNTNNIYFAKHQSPLFITITNDEIFGASDIVCFANKTNQFYRLEDGEFCVANLKNIKFYNKNAQKIEKNMKKIEKIVYETQKSGFLHYMEKEIYQTPEVVKNIFESYKNGNIITLPKTFLKGVNRVKFVGCGTAYHSTLFGSKFFEKINNIESTSHLASEFENEFLTSKTLCVFVSQSGETADTLGAVEISKKHNCKTIALTNVMHSTLASKVEICLPIMAGIEIGVASTKAYSAQILVMQILANHFASKQKQKDFWKQFENFANSLKIPQSNIVQKIVNHIGSSNQCFVLGRAKDYYTALESALKIKEITYINCNAMPSGELKHGTLALIDDTIPIIMFCTNKNQLDKSLSAKKEMEARGGKVLFLTPFEKYDGSLQNFDEIFMPISAILPMQLCAYKISNAKGYNPDQPRNLAKSVTVE